MKDLLYNKNLWLYSDPHFGHKNIIEFCNRPFFNVDNMNDQLVTRFNDCVMKGDTVLWLGDCFFTDAWEAKHILSLMKGRHLLVRGNHDGTKTKMESIGFEVLEPFSQRYAGRTFHFNHYPKSTATVMRGDKYDTRYADRRPVIPDDEFLIHGHTHSKEGIVGNTCNVGVDAWDYAPVSWSGIRFRMIGE